MGVITPHFPMREGDGYYSCWFSISDLPFDQVTTVYGHIVDERHLFTERWLGGTQPQPPPGSQRTVIGSRGVTLTPRQPSATVDLEMVYRAIRTPPR